ncbi:hypothetical protein RAA17_11230 [Komagataeibacter rhaeticus]|nr:hypothetical protein [Komagataeibacter rhaeticus]
MGSLLAQTNILIVQRQIAYGQARGIPWGISESAYNVRDLEYTYQYSNFGIPGLGLKRGLGLDTVVAPTPPCWRRWWTRKGGRQPLHTGENRRAGPLRAV